MRHDNIPYVPNPPRNYYPAIPLEEMSLEEIKKKYLKMCAKCNGNVSICSKCESPCREGKRAIQLIANTIYDQPNVPLYGGKTLIERAKEENMKRRAELEKKEEVKEEKPKKKLLKLDGWYEKAMEADDPIAWIMETFELSRAKARQRVYDWRFHHPEVKENDVFIQKTAKKTEKKQAVKEEKVEVKKDSPEVKTDSLEAKLELLLKQQEEHKKKMNEYMELYNKEKEKYDKIKQKTDILCSAMDILND